MGGISPVWSPDGRELLYNSFSDPYAMMRVTVDRAGDDPSALTVGTPEVLFDHRSRTQRNSHNHALSPDGQRFLMFTGSLREYPPLQVVLVQNWFEELTRLVPVL